MLEAVVSPLFLPLVIAKVQIQINLLKEYATEFLSTTHDLVHSQMTRQI